MNLIIVYVVVLITLFVLAYVTKRRFGVLGLALAAGAMLSSLWAEKLTPLVQAQGFDLSAPPMIIVVSVSLVLLPSVLLLVSGPTYHKKIEQIIGAFLFALLAVALLVEPLGSNLVLEGESLRVYNWLMEYRVWIVTFGLIAALVDILFAKTPKHRKSKH